MRFYTEWLFSKYGLSDGDILDDLVYEHCTEAEYPDFDDHRLLHRVVTEHVAPTLHPDLARRIVFTETTHNPLRIDDHDWYEDLCLDAPEYVEVDDAVIVAMLHEQRAATV